MWLMRRFMGPCQTARIAVVCRGGKALKNFHEWLIKQRGRQDPVGDLARDMMADPEWPSDAHTLRGLDNYLHFRWACEGAHQALKRAWNEWLRDTGVKLSVDYMRLVQAVEGATPGGAAEVPF